MRKFLTFTGFFLLAFLLIVSVLYFWLIDHAEQLVQQFIYNESNGNVDLRISRVRYDHGRNRLILYDTRIVSSDTTSKASRYDISAEKFTLRIGTLKSIFATGRLNIDSILCESPKVGVVKLRPGVRKEVSIPEEMSRITAFLEKTLQKLRIHQLRVENGEFTLKKEYSPASRPIRINRISLTIDDIHLNEKKGDEERIMFSDRILLETRQQDIQFFDERHGLRFSRFRLNTRTRRIELDSCYIYGHGKDPDYGSFDIFFDSLHFTRTDLGILARQDIIKADTVLCINPDIRFLFDWKKPDGSVPFTGSARAKDSVEAVFRELFGNLDIGFIGVRNAAVDITARRNGQESRYTTTESNFTLHDLQIMEDPGRPIRLGRFDIEIMDYVGYSSDSLYAIRFDSIQLLDNKLSLSNFSIHATPANTNAEWRDVHMKAFEMNDIFWPDLLFNNRIKATNATLLRPEVELNLTRGFREKRKPKGALYLAIAGFRKYLEMDNLLLRDASVSIRSDNASVLRMNDFNTRIDVKRFLRSGDATDIIGSIHSFSFGNGSLSNLSENISFLSGVYDGSTQKLGLGKATYTNERNPLVISAEDLLLTEAERTPDNQFKASDVSWRKADISMKRSGIPVPRKETPEKPLLIGWNRTSGSNTLLTIESGDTRFSTSIRQLHTGSVLIPTDGKPRINGTDLTGSSLVFRDAGFQASIDNYHVLDEKTSAFTGIGLSIPVGRKRVVAKIPRLDMVPDLESFIDNKPSLSAIILQGPLINFETNSDALRRDKRELPSFTIGELQVIDPVIGDPSVLLPEGTEMSLGIPSLKALNVRSNSQSLTIGRMETSLRGPKLRSGQLTLDATGMADVSATLSNFTSSPSGSGRTGSWNFTVDRLDIPGLRIHGTGSDANRNSGLWLEGSRIGQLEMTSERRTTMAGILAGSPMAEIMFKKMRTATGTDSVILSGMHYRYSLHSLSLDSTRSAPLMDRESFTKSLSYQKDHISFSTGGITVRDFDLTAYLNDSVLRAGRVDVSEPDLDIFRDRRLPFRSGIIKPLPTALLNRMGKRFSIDSLRIHDGLFTYEEMNERSGKKATVPFTRTQALLTDLRNIGQGGKDSLGIIAHTRLADTADLRLQFRESYTDSLNGFLMALNIGRFGLPALNGILEPMGSARIISGGMDTVHMNATGGEYFAWGRMNMYYHDLKVQFLNKEDYTRKTITTRISNFLANTLMLRKGNVRKTGTIYSERNREKSFFNYWIKIALSGMLTNAGIRAKTKEERKKHREIRSRDLPDLPDTELD